MDKDRIKSLSNWLRQGDENEAADIIEECEIDYIFENLYLSPSSEREYFSYDVNIKTPRQILKKIEEGLLKVPVEQIEIAIRDFSKGDHNIHTISWIAATLSSKESFNSDSLIVIDSKYIHRAWEIALSRKLNDPEGAITASRTLVESVCKYILDEKKISYTREFDLPKLFYLTMDSFNLNPNQHPEKLIKQVLGNWQAVAGGIAALRNELGDAHGKGINDLMPLPAYAELSVNLAGSIALFLNSIWEDEKIAANI